jgi:hypothetical protein
VAGAFEPQAAKPRPNINAKTEKFFMRAVCHALRPPSMRRRQAECIDDNWPGHPIGRWPRLPGNFGHLTCHKPAWGSLPATNYHTPSSRNCNVL